MELKRLIENNSVIYIFDTFLFQNAYSFITAILDFGYDCKWTLYIDWAQTPVRYFLTRYGPKEYLYFPADRSKKSLGLKGQGCAFNVIFKQNTPRVKQKHVVRDLFPAGPISGIFVL